MQVDLFTAYLVSAMTSWTPPGQHREGDQVAQERYRNIARDIATVAASPDEEPVFDDDDDRVKTALLLASIASFESAYRADVDEGRRRGDGGVSWCLLQVQVRGRTREGWTGQDLVSDRRKCITAGLHRIKTSFDLCHTLPLSQRLSGYTIGKCRPSSSSRYRMDRAIHWFHDHPPPQVRAALEPSASTN